MSCLVVTTGRAKGHTYKISPDGENVVGRVNDCDVCIADGHVSRRHCLITAGQAGYIVKDLGSANGTCLNGVRVTEAPLKDGDQLSFGTVQVEFHLTERFEDAETKHLVSGKQAGPAAGAPPRKAQVRTDTQAMLEFCEQCSGSIPVSAIATGKAKRLNGRLLCAECLAKAQAGADAASASKLFQELTAPAPAPAPAGAAAPAAPAPAPPAPVPPTPAPAAGELDADGLPALPDEPKVDQNAKTPLPGAGGR
jgi:predicted component of type VI protein secretion system